jgi:hypothetical protein
MYGSATLQVLLGAALTINIPADPITGATGTLSLNDQFRLVNSGTITWNGGRIFLGGTSVIQNNPAGPSMGFIVTFSGSISGTGTFNNNGAFTQTAGPGAFLQFTSIGCAFNNQTLPGGPTAAVIVATGSLTFGGSGTQSGVFATNVNARITFEGGATQTLNSGAEFNGTGSIELLSTFNVTAGTTVTCFPQLILGDTVVLNVGGLRLVRAIPATLSGPGTFVARGDVLWRAGSLSNLGNFTNMGTMSIEAPVGVALNSSLLLNLGTIQWMNGDISFNETMPGIVPRILNNLGNIVIGSPNVPSTLAMLLVGTSSGELINLGTIDVLANTTTTFAVDFQQQGMFQLDNGTTTFDGIFALQGGVTTLGTGAVVANSTAFITGSTLNLGAAGDLTAPEGLAIESGGSVVGIGTITGNVTNNGRIDISDRPFLGGPRQIGTLNIIGTYVQGATGRLILGVAQNVAGGFDQLAVTGTATLAGTLTVVPLVGLPMGFDLMPNTNLALVTFANRNATTFDQIDCDPLNRELILRALPAATVVQQAANVMLQIGN